MADRTIFALSSGAGRAGIAIIRLTGPSAGDALSKLIGEGIPEPRHAKFAGFRVPGTEETIDDGLALWFPGPHSVTGEDVAECHVHGGPAVVAAMLAALGDMPGLRPAEPGEFTRRAFDNGKLDLTAAEGLADLINAETAQQRRQAHRQLSGELAMLYDGWRDELLRAIALMEAEIDFSDEDLPGDLPAEAAAIAAGLEAAIEDHLADNRRGQHLRDGVYIAVLGPPNAGKSSLVNWLARRDAAIVSAEAGTTRDVVEVHLDLDGFPVIVADTAGLREAGGEIEAEGVRRALDRGAVADLKLLVLDGAIWPEFDPSVANLLDDNTLIIINKSDIGKIPQSAFVADRPAWVVSVKDGDGLDDLLDDIAGNVRMMCQPSASPTLTRERHRAALRETVDALARVRGGQGAELVAEDLRLAARALGRITGRVDVEEVLDLIFGEFCIGK